VRCADYYFTLIIIQVTANVTMVSNKEIDIVQYADV